MRALRAVAIAAIGGLAVAAVPAVAEASAKPSGKAPAWVRQALDATPKITSGSGLESVEIKSGARSTELDNEFAFDRDARYFSSDITTGNLDEVLQVYVLGDAAWLALASPQFANRLPSGVRFVSVAVQDLAASGVVNTDRAVNFAPLFILLGATHVKPKPKQGAGEHVYTFDVDLAAARKAVPDASRAAFAKAFGSVPVGRLSGARGTATIDDQHHVRDLGVTFDVKAAGKPRLTFDFGLDTVDESVPAVTPPAPQTVAIDSVPGLHQQLQQLIGNSAAGSI